MRAAVLLVGLGAFTLSLLLHVAWWRLGRPRADVRYLFLVFFGVPVVLAAATLVGVPVSSVPFLAGSSLSLVEAAAALLLAWALGAAYVQTYPAAQAQSPSLVVLLHLGGAPEGLTQDELLARFGPSSLVGNRIDDLVTNAFVRETPEGLTLTLPGRILASFFATYRGILGLRPKGG